MVAFSSLRQAHANAKSCHEFIFGYACMVEGFMWKDFNANAVPVFDRLYVKRAEEPCWASASPEDTSLPRSSHHLNRRATQARLQTFRDLQGIISAAIYPLPAHPPALAKTHTTGRPASSPALNSSPTTASRCHGQLDADVGLFFSVSAQQCFL